MSSNQSSDPAEVRIEIRLWQRIFVTLFGLVWFGGIGTALYLGVRDSSVPIPAIFMFLLGLFVFNSVLRLRLVTRDDQVVVRNAYKTARLRRSEIAEFRIGRGTGGAGSRAILIVPHEGEIITVDVSKQISSRPGDRLSTTMAELTAWHTR